MLLPFFIARRYLFSVKKTSFISLISWLALLGIALGTAAIIIILSVFNGLEDLNKSIFKSFDADLSVYPIKGKTFNPNVLNSSKIASDKRVAFTVKVLQDNALIRYGDDQSVAQVKGVDNNFLLNKNFKNSIIEGKPQFTIDSSDAVILGLGLQQKLFVDTESFYLPLEFWYPDKKKNPLVNPAESFVQSYAYPSAIFAIEQAYDQVAVVPISLAQQLFQKSDQISYLEIYLKNIDELAATMTDLKKNLPAGLQILSSEDQHQGILQAIKLEKLFVFLILVIITGIAALNIFFSISLLVIEKKKDINTLNALGANKSLIFKMFSSAGMLIGFTGIIIGVVLGLGLCWLQQRYGFAKMGMTTALVDAYPIRIQWSDVLFTFLAIAAVTLLVIQLPAQKASNFIRTQF